MFSALLIRGLETKEEAKRADQLFSQCLEKLTSLVIVIGRFNAAVAQWYQALGVF